MAIEISKINKHQIFNTTVGPQVEDSPLTPNAAIGLQSTTIKGGIQELAADIQSLQDMQDLATLFQNALS